MVTQYDVFAKIVRHAPCKQKELEFATRIDGHLSLLVKRQFIKRTTQGYVPIKNKKTSSAVDIISASLKSGINYNVFFSKEFVMTIDQLNKHPGSLRPLSLQNNKNFKRILDFLEEHQFVLVYSKKPRQGTIVSHPLLIKSALFVDKKISITTNLSLFHKLLEQVESMPEFVFNPFAKSYFAHIAGSAQLEGSTISIGQTIEMLTKDVYPDKEHKEIQMVKNLDEATRYVQELPSTPLHIDMIKEINKRVLYTLHKGAGTIKKTQNKIQGNPHFKTSPPHLVFQHLETYCKWINSLTSRKQIIQQLGKIHNEFQHIHPFIDGNSRTTRVLVNWILNKHKLPPVVLRSGSFDVYMSLTKLAKKRFDDELRNLLCHVLIHEQVMNNYV